MTTIERLELAWARANSLAVYEAMVAEGRMECTPMVHGALASLACATSLDLELALGVMSRPRQRVA